MKRLLTLAAMFLCCIATSFAQFSGSGSGTENDPYLVLNPIHLNQLRNYLNQSGVYFKLMANIDLTDYIEDEWGAQGWLPVGNSSSQFKGIFDGNGKTISGLTINRENMDFVGLFGDTDHVTIKNLTLKGNVKGHNSVGGIAGDIQYGTMTNCSFEGKVGGVGQVGGLSGYAEYGTLSDCTCKAEITGTGDKIGGIVGNYGTFVNCVASDVIVKGNNYVGGICGYINSNMTNCCFYGNVYGNSYVGGLSGYEYSYTIKGCYAVAHVEATGSWLGGLIGNAKGTTLLNNYFSGSVSGSEQVGGLIGYQEGGSTKYCYAKAKVIGSKLVGGLVGKINSNSSSGGYLSSNISINSSIKATVGNVGRIYGDKGGNYVRIGVMGTVDENKAWNKAIVISAGVAQDVTDDEQNGTGVSATTLKLKATYVAMNWDFKDTWAIQETECYPYVKSQTAPPVIQSQVVSGATTISGKCVDGGTITLEIDGEKLQMVSSGNNFSFNVSPLQAGHEVRVSAKAEGKEMSYYTTETVSYLGKGTEADPYRIYTAADLTGVYRKGYFKLMNDIDLTSYINQFSPTEGWESIGREGSETIHFDGDGHKITGLWCNSTRNNTGLFSSFANGEIKNLTVETASGKQVKGGANTGIIIGKMINGSLVNCHVSGNVADGTPVGGMVGLMDGGSLQKCQASVTINCEGNNSYIGGLVGELNGEMNQCLSRGTLTCTGTTANIGGLVGLNQSNSTITNSYSTALVNSTYCAAGIVAYNYGLVDKCYASGNMFSKNYGAGIIGYNDGEKAIVQNCVALNKKLDVTYESQQVQQGGGYGQRIIGGIKNGAPAPEMNNYALKTMQVSLNDVPQTVYDDIMNGTAKSGIDLMAAATYQELGWDFSTIWKIEEGSSYPYLVVNEGGTDPSTDPDPQPTTDDYLSANAIKMKAGETTTIDILLNNKATDYTAYQFDLTLPEGFTIAKNKKDKWDVTKGERYEDDTQQLTVDLLDASTNTYRFICFSMSNGVIEGTEGCILKVVVKAEENVADGDYYAKMKNITFTRADGTGNTLSDAQFKITINSVILGDANGDGEVNVSDIVEIVNYIMNKPSDKFVLAAADLNGDGEVNVTDIVKVVSIIMSSGSNAPKRAAVAEMVDNDQLTLTVGDNSLSLCLDNEAQYVASQFEIRLGNGQTLESISLNNKRSGGHLLSYAKTGDNLYKVVVYSTDNRPFNGNSGELLSFKVSGTGNVEISNILFVTSGETEKLFPALVAGTTGIDVIKTSDAMDIYSIDGRLIQKQATNTNGLKKGLYIINGKKLIVK